MSNKKRILISALFAVFAATTFGADKSKDNPSLEYFDLNNKMHCGPAEEKLNTITHKWEELPIFSTIEDDDTSVVLFMNRKSKSWTLLQIIKTPHGTSACIIDTGEQGKLDLKNMMSHET